MGYEQGYAEE